MLTRRRFLEILGQGYVATRLASLASAAASRSVARDSMRCINIVNFIRAVEPRFQMDLMLPVQRQMEIIRSHDLPATWLLQFDALVSGPFVPFLKEHMAASHEVGSWFEMNEMHCRAAEVEWRGRPGYEWDYFPSVAFTLGYTKEERVKLADTAMREFKKTWGQYPSSVASWNLDAFTIAHLVDHYGIDAFAVCRDQIATDGFTIWGAPIAGYYPSRSNCWSPAVDRSRQLGAPVFRMLGQDPVYYYQREWSIRGGPPLRAPDTMEPVWPSGQDPAFVRHFLRMIEEAPALGFSYAQLGQENSFPWDQQSPGYGPQMQAVAELRSRGAVHVETLGESGRRFKRTFKETPVQAQVMLDDPFGNTEPSCGSIWYQSRFYRANLHLEGDLAYLRDLTVYSDHIAQPYLDEPARVNDVEQRLPAVIDGYHWRKGKKEPAGAFFCDGETRLLFSGKPEVQERGSSLDVRLPMRVGGLLQVRFDERGVVVSGPPGLALSFEWDASKSALQNVATKRLVYRWQGFDYGVDVAKGSVRLTPMGCRIGADDGVIQLLLAQTGLKRP